MNSKALIIGLALVLALSATTIVADESDAAVGIEEISYTGNDQSGSATVVLSGYPGVFEGGAYLLELNGPQQLTMRGDNEDYNLITNTIEFHGNTSTSKITMGGTYSATVSYQVGHDTTLIASFTGMTVSEVEFTNGEDSVMYYVCGSLEMPSAQDLGFGSEEFSGWDANGDGQVDYVVGEDVAVTGDMTLEAVFGDAPTPVIEDIVVAEMPDKTEYTEGETLDLTGLVIEAEMSIGDNVEIQDYITTPANGAVLGLDDTSVTVSYQGFETSFDITVKESGTPAVPVIDVVLDKTTATLDVDETVTLTATVSPDNATNKDVTWTSSNPAVATVVNGVVTAKAAGTAVITVTTVDGGKTASCTVTVTSEPAPQPVLDSITVSGEFDEVYQVRDTLDLDGMVVTAHYTNGGDDKVLSEGDYTVTPANGSRLNSVIDHVTVSYTEGGVTRTVEVPITVTELPVYTVSKDCENGTVSGPSEIVEGGSGSYTVSPDYGYRISAVSYTVVGGQPVSVAVVDVMRCSFEIQNVIGPVTITATFESDATGTVTVTAGDHGSIGAGGATSAPVTVYRHWSTTVTIDPDNGYRVSGISHDGAENSVTYEDGVLTIAAGSDVTKIDIAFEQIPVSDDEEEYVPPVITVIPGDDDDSTTYIVAIAAAAVVAILAALILMQTRKS